MFIVFPMKKHLFLLSFLVATTACAPTVANRGNILDLDVLAEIKPGTTTREVASKLGSPTVMSTFDDKVSVLCRASDRTVFLSFARSLEATGDRDHFQ